MIGFDWFLVPRFAHRRACRRRHGRVGVVVGGSWALSLRGSSTGVVGQNCWLGAQWGTGDPPDGGHLVSSHYGWTLVTDGRVDDQLVWWSWHSKLSAWSPVRVSQVVISVLLTERRTVTEDVRWSISWPSQISGDEVGRMISSSGRLHG